jgi:hypothetical protein
MPVRNLQVYKPQDGVFTTSEALVTELPKAQQPDDGAAGVALQPYCVVSISKSQARVAWPK